jgi:hypothetical protein
MCGFDRCKPRHSHDGGTHECSNVNALSLRKYEPRAIQNGATMKSLIERVLNLYFYGSRGGRGQNSAIKRGVVRVGKFCEKILQA